MDSRRRRYSRQAAGLLCAMAVTVTASCSREGSADGLQENMMLKICAENSVSLTRTQLTGPDCGQHVSRAILYLYEEVPDEGRFVCVAEEEIPWSHPAGTEEGLPRIEEYYRIRYGAVRKDLQYRLVVAGLDMSSPVTYGIPGSPEIGDDYTDAHAALVEGLGRRDIATSELFGNSITVTGYDIINPGKTVSIILDRRVAGVMLYVKNIPAEYDGTQVSGVKVRLHTAQNTMVKLYPDPPVDGEFMDYITSPLKSGDADTILEIQRPESSSGISQASSAGAYVLPAIQSFTDGTSTLTLDLIAFDGSILLSRKVIMDEGSLGSETKSGTGIIGDPFEGITDISAYHYPIKANNFYSIGSASSPIDMSGKEMEVHVSIDNGWGEYYAGNIGDQTGEGIGIDNSWGDRPSGNIIKE